MSSACGACTKDIFIARDCSPRLAISAKHATAVGVRRARSTVVTAQPQRKLPWRDAAAAFPPCGERFTRPALRQSPAFQGAAARCRASPSFHPAQGPDAECEARGEVISASLLPPNPWREPTSAAAVHVRSDSGACRGSPVGSRDQVNSSSKAAAPTGLIRYRSIPASRASSRPGCSLLAVNAISLRFCNCGC